MRVQAILCDADPQSWNTKISATDAARKGIFESLSPQSCLPNQFLMELMTAAVAQWGDERAIKALSIREQACLTQLVLILIDAAGISAIESSPEILHGLLNVCFYNRLSIMHVNTAQNGIKLNKGCPIFASAWHSFFTPMIRTCVFSQGAVEACGHWCVC
jgi:hypothetical protein